MNHAPPANHNRSQKLSARLRRHAEYLAPLLIVFGIWAVAAIIERWR